MKRTALSRGMSMQFCPQCGMRLRFMPSRAASGSAMHCANCGFQPSNVEQSLVKAVEGKPSESIVVIDEEAANIRTMPTMRVECAACGNGEAFVWMVQTRGGDEASTQFFRCTKCGITWREYA
ncbi:MAG: transcription factor S [Candidatus Bathyarchaeia archaeon]